MPLLLNLANRLDFGFGINFVLRHDYRHRAKTFNNRADKGTNIRTGQKHAGFAFDGQIFKHGTDFGDKALKRRRGHGQLAVIPFADNGFSKGLFPCRRQSNQRNNSLFVGIGIGNLASQAGADMFGYHHQAAGGGHGLGNAFQNGGQIADGNAFLQQILQNTLDGTDADFSGD